MDDSFADLCEKIEKAVNDVLEEQGIYDMDSYGWLGPETVDPEYIGHAMWQLTPPVDIPVRYKLTEIEKELLLAGSDFEGLMKASRLSIGLALLHEGVAEDQAFGNDFFWLHYTDAMVKLNMAFERLSHFFVISVTGETFENFKKKKRRYSDLYNEASKILATTKMNRTVIMELVSTLEEVIQRILKEFRYERNAIVHEMGSRWGKRLKEMLEEYDSGPIPISETGFDFEKEVGSAVKHITDWYKLLIQASNYIFQIEYWGRVNARRI